MPATTPKSSKARIPKQTSKKSGSPTARKSAEIRIEQEERAETTTPNCSVDQDQIESEEDRKTKLFYQLGIASGIENRTENLFEHFSQGDGTMLSVPLEPQLVLAPEEIAHRQSERAVLQQMLFERILSQQDMIKSLQVQLQMAQSTIAVLIQHTAQSNGHEK